MRRAINIFRAAVAVLLLLSACAPAGGGSPTGSGGASGGGGSSGAAGGGGSAAGPAGNGGTTGGVAGSGRGGGDSAGSGGSQPGGAGGSSSGGSAGGSGSGGSGNGGSGNGGGGASGVSGGGGGGAAGTGGRGGSGAAGTSGRGGAAGAGGRGGAGAGSGGASGSGGTSVVGPVVLTDDGGWCWFESPRALFQGNRLIVGSVASGWSAAARRGDIDAIVHDLGTGTTTVVELHNQLELDDHDSPAFVARPDGRLLALFARHDGESRFYYRLSNANNPLVWGAEQTFVPSASTRVTYSNVFLLTGEQNRIYDFYRGLDGSFKPSYAYSDDLGQTWRSGNVVINVPSTDRHRPYARYASNNVDTIHITYTEAHPRDFDNSLYHAYYKGGTLYRSDGTAVRSLGQGLTSPDEGTRIFRGDAQNVAWSVDVTLDSAGRPHTVYSVQIGSAGLPVGQGGNDIRYRYARWDGGAWRDFPLAFAGSRLYAGEDDYSGLAVLDPADPSVVYISTNADPLTGTALTSTADSRRHYEIFRGNTGNGGQTWQWTAITRNSSTDNLRPILVDDGAGQKALLWLRGTYRSYTDYQQQVVALFWRGP